MTMGIIVLAAALAFLAVTPVKPHAGLISFVILLFLRPNDLIPAVAAVPFVKIALGITLLSVLLHWSRYQHLFLQLPHVKALLCFLMAMAASVPFSFWPGASFQTTVDFLKVVLLYFLIINLLTSPRELSQFLWAMLICACILAVSAVRRYFAGEFEMAGLRIVGLVGGSFGDPNDLALSFVMLIPLAYFMSGASQSSIGKLALWSILLALTLGVIAAQSRGGFLGLGLVLLLIVKQSHHRLAASVLLGVLLIVVVFLAPDGSFGRISSIADYEEDESAVGRLIAWKAGLRMFADNPAFGVGAGVFEVAYGQAYRPEGVRGKWIAPHSSYVQVLAETGLLGFICFLSIIVISIKHLWLARQSTAHGQHDQDVEGLVKLNKGITVGIWGFLACAAFLTQAYAWLFNIAIALSIVVNRQIAEQLEFAHSVNRTSDTDDQTAG